jgi:hypothetical protein
MAAPTTGQHSRWRRPQQDNTNNTKTKKRKRAITYHGTATGYPSINNVLKRRNEKIISNIARNNICIPAWSGKSSTTPSQQPAREPGQKINQNKWIGLNCLEN